MVFREDSGVETETDDEEDEGLMMVKTPPVRE